MTAAKTSASDSFNEIATVRVELTGTDPLIWRTVDVPTSATLKALHDIIQAAVGWMNYHLWEFMIDKRRYGPPMGDGYGAEPRRDAAKVRLRDVLKPGATEFDYVYDFGDNWEHRLTISNVRQGEPDTPYPRYTGGEWNGPPEDCGGIPGFYETLDAFTDPDHPDHARIVEWLDEFDPKFIDEEAIGYALLRLARRRNAAALRFGRKKSAPEG